MMALTNFLVAIALISSGYCLGLIVAMLIDRHHMKKAEEKELRRKIEKLLDKAEDK